MITVKKHINYGEIDFVMCAKKGYFKDDKKGYCSKCGESVVYRPYIPDDVVKMCIDCGYEVIKND